MKTLVESINESKKGLSDVKPLLKEAFQILKDTKMYGACSAAIRESLIEVFGEEEYKEIKKYI